MRVGSGDGHRPSAAEDAAPAQPGRRGEDEHGDTFGEARRSASVSWDGGAWARGGKAAAAVAWNCSGSLLAVAYGFMRISGTDTASSAVAVWNLQRQYVRADVPDELLDTHASVMAAAFHPSTAPPRLRRSCGRTPGPPRLRRRALVAPGHALRVTWHSTRASPPGDLGGGDLQRAAGSVEPRRRRRRQVSGSFMRGCQPGTILACDNQTPLFAGGFG